MKYVKNETGFTMIELIVVIAIMGIISAVLIPQFATLSLRSRIGADISSLKTVQQQIDIYFAERNHYPGNDVQTIVSTLVAESYLAPKYLNGSTIYLETQGAQMIYDGSASHVKLKVTASEYALYNKESDRLEWLTQ